MAFYPDERIGLFIDGANLFSTTKALDFDIDFKRLLDEFRKRGKLIRANYYTALLEHEDYNPLRPLVDWLDYNGFSVITKPAREFTDDSGRRRIKGDMDIELAIDMVEAASYLDHIILFSGDGDFRRAIQAAQSRGARVSVVSSLKTQPSMVSDDLRRAADTFIELADLEGMIGRNGGGS
ncbi:MAG: NYN domain-containing protein [Oceanicaulis sp.]|uniref:NYN domain-containing protein n=1 Tax=Maricaulis virginensis TaxID=144022 RepID=A0A9W6IKA9_9PROT|nr:NYN domain-containing protein [Maricaulis virginensis]MAZ91961.1 NYN domain-containing protein [Maricaulis sp.]MAZ92343.1 NYN domain-containing protein [Maricaulis sp.]MBI75202.1 NYN domain-containing protein [Oceanicaulis sp.]GLK51142.1 NYN domain-containing protein [Maricaulis virginensis]